LRKTALPFLVWLILSIHTEAAGLEVSEPVVADDGVIWYEATSSFNGPDATTLRVLSPAQPAPGMSRRFIYVLPAIAHVDLESEFGDGLEALRALNVHNDYNACIIAPSFLAEPWYADHASDPDRRYESFMIQDLVPWVRANLSVTGVEEHWLLGFSKSGYGAVTLLLRHPTVFDAAAAWDFPADEPDAFGHQMLDNYGSDENFQANYRLTNDFIAGRREPFRTERRLWLSDDHVTYRDAPTYRNDVLAFASRLQANEVLFLLEGGETRIHTWSSGWVGEAVAGLQKLRYSGRDNFNRPVGPLGPSWWIDPSWGTGLSISGYAVTAPPGNGGAAFWAAQAYGADQYSQVRIAGEPGDWTGVTVRGGVSPAQGYWAVVKGDGVHLQAFDGAAFHALGHVPTAWSTGDVLRLEARTVAAGTAQLTVLRNGSPVLAYDDVEHFIDGGQPGIGLQATSAVSLDDWQGGELPPPPPPPPSGPADDFDRDDGPLGQNWVNAPEFGSGAFISGHRVVPASSSGGAYFWSATTLGADQYSQITIAGDIGTWTGVAVRGGVSPPQGYWLAVKADGAYLYSYMNGAFHRLVHDVTPWSTGDVLRLDVQTVTSGMARLTVRRNGTALFSRDDADHFIESGQPGIGLYSTGISLDTWRGGELSPAEGSPSEPPPGEEESQPPEGALASDSFNRANGPIGSNWVSDPAFGAGASISGRKVAASSGSGGAFLWDALDFASDQYSAIAIAGDIGSWTGVCVRGSISPADGYWVAIKSDGAHLYARVDQAFHLLAYDATAWSTGDALKLEVFNAAAGTARLTVYRNGDPLFTRDESLHFIDGGNPGIGLYGNGTMALDDWHAGEVEGGDTGAPPPPPPGEEAQPLEPSWLAEDRFDRADGPLGSDWLAAPAFGSGTSISNNAVRAPGGGGGAYFWNAGAFPADQYSAITIAGQIGDWTGVCVRGGVSPAQGYWLAVKGDGAYLYAHVNGAFYLLAFDPTPWRTGDRLRLEVRTVAAGTARLAVYRNGSLLLAHDDAVHFIESGQPGIGLYATGAMAIDDWRGGEASAGE